MSDLTTVAAVQAYTGTTGNAQVLGLLVTAASSSVIQFISQNLFQATYTESYTGTGTKRLLLRQGPVTAVSSVTINGTAVPASTNGSYGWVFDKLGLTLVCGIWPEWPLAISVTYTAGYAPIAVTDPPATIPSGLVLAAQNLYWQSDVGVTYFVGGAALTKVDVAPAAGEYFVDSLGNYTFNTADLNKSVVISYKIIGIPQDISQATTEIVGLNFMRRTKLNVQSKTIDAQTEAYITSDWPPSALQIIQQWQRTFPQ